MCLNCFVLYILLANFSLNNKITSQLRLRVIDWWTVLARLARLAMLGWLG